MSHQLAQQAIDMMPAISGSLLLDDSKTTHCLPSCNDKSHGFAKVSVLRRVNKLGLKADLFAHFIREHVKLGTNILDTVKAKLSIGARMEKVFKALFNIPKKERLLKASQCCLSTQQREILEGILSQWQNCRGPLQGIDPTCENRMGKPKSECGGSVAEVHSDSYNRQVRLLVHGILESSEDMETSSAGNFSVAEI
ncbi:hypothetical protein SAY87_006071 [Trapa incisa]|uniref:Uncharacterized protein n=1 Tax=Trapa incisa TaxID=236973 RepID=A0AAN7Q870_9MYRT|nr:hypothetical protein SAY87_006071 [Trapa incisa]